MTHKIGLLLAIAAIIFFSTACARTDPGGDPVQADSFQVDPVFREFYDLLGGKETLGPVISPVFDIQSTEYQYAEAGLMVRELGASGEQNFRLASLGLDMGVAEPPVPDPDQPGVRYLDGHTIYEAFLPLYEKLGGAHYVGKPLTEMHYDPEKGRYEQFFENLGFYRLEQDPPERVHLLAYGVWKCDSSCRQRDPGAAIVDLPFQVGKPFQDAVARLGPDFTGFAISEVYRTPDDYTEQVFENLVLVVAPDESGRLFLRPITASLGIRPDKPAEQNGDRNGFVFVPVQGNKGYYVYQKFLDYLAQHGGLDASGNPVGAWVQVDDSKSRQCFTNLCLEERRTRSGSVLIRPAPNGYTYKLLPLQPVNVLKSPTSLQIATNPTQVPQPQVAQPEATRQDLSSLPASQPAEVVFSTPQAREVTMKVWDIYQMLAPDQDQEIGVSISENNVPLSGLEPYLTITLPNNESKTYYMELTGEDGASRIVIGSISAPNGTLIPYQVCVLDMNNEKYCVRDSFMVWQNP